MHEEQGKKNSLPLSQLLKIGEKGCESCKKWQEHYYWEHMDVSKTRFFKLMTQDSQQRIRIPDKFASSFIRQTQSSQGFHLKAPSGETWHVGVTKVADDLFFSSGWGDFVKAHELQENDLLVFTFSGNSSFEVLVFDASGCEKLSSLFAGTGNMGKHFHGMVGQQVEQCSMSDDSEDDDEDDDNNDDDTSVPSQSIESRQKVSTSRKFSGKTKPRKELLESPNSSSSCDVKHEATEEEESDDDTYADFDCYYSRTAKQLRDDEKREIIGLASIQPGNPAFMTVLLRTHLPPKINFLYIPINFAVKHLHMRSHEVLLLRPNREERWHVKYYYYEGVSSRGFKGQPWAKFVCDNKLREGDVCIFELIKGARNEKKAARTAMAVHIARRRKSNGRFALVG